MARAKLSLPHQERASAHPCEELVLKLERHNRPKPPRHRPRQLDASPILDLPLHPSSCLVGWPHHQSFIAPDHIFYLLYA